ncbi:MAG: topoisomerase IV, partial [Oscillospiraceae bacterium]|nr:topoisomerase IV [Oscillospiraceae bacterium]
MARTKKEKEIVKDSSVPSNAYIANGGIVVEQSITDTLETNYMPYAMSVIVSRALPEIDGFKPAHRKLLYTMYKMGLLGSTRMKSANVVGQTMRLNPHGDASIYETLVRMSRGYEALLHPFVDSKGNFGKAYSRDMAYAASRYTEVKLEPIANELFRDIDKDAVDFVPNYDNTMLEPTLLPAVFPTILVNANVGIAVSMASSICSFNLGEVCEATIALIRDEEADISGIIKGPDFSGGGLIIHDQAELEKIFRTGRGSVKVRAKYSLDKENGCIDVTEIPPTTTIEAIMDKIVELVKGGKIREISYIRDEIDKNGLKLCIDIKRGTDPDKLMQKLYKMTPLEDTYSCNFNVLVGGTPKVMGVYEIISEWVAFRLECVKRRIYFDLTKKKDKLHLLKGLNKILLDIDKAIKIVRETEEEAEVVPNLMIGFGLDQTQAEYVAEIKLRHLNREYILKRTAEIEELTKAIADMEDTLSSNRKVKQIIISELQDIIKKYPQPRKSLLMSQDVAEIEEEEQEQVPDYPVNIFVTKEGYFKKITPQSLR